MPKSGVWETAIKQSADPERAKNYGSQFDALKPGYLQGLGPNQAGVLAALFSGSRALSELLLAKPDWIDALDIERLRNPRRKEGLVREVQTFLAPALEARDYAAALAQLRQFKQCICELKRIRHVEHELTAERKQRAQ